MWHFHPDLLKKYYSGRDAIKELPSTGTLDEIKKLNLYAVGGTFYSKTDVLSTDSVVLVPNYVNIEAAKADAIEAADKNIVYTAVQNAQNGDSPKGRRAVASIDKSPEGTRRRVSEVTDHRSKSDEELEGMNADQLREFVRTLQGSCMRNATALKQAEDELAVLRQGVRAQKFINECGDTALCRKLTEENEKLILENNEFKMAGLNRISMSNSDYGFPDFDYLKGFIEEMLDVEYISPEKPTMSAGGKGRRGNGLSEFEQVLLTLFLTNTTWKYDTIGSVFGVNNRVTVGGYISKWMPLLGELGDMRSSFTY